VHSPHVGGPGPRGGRWQNAVTNTCDVAIVGGGPAGAFAAYLLAKRGAHVRVFDPSHPREKPCGGGVTGRALALVAPLLDQRRTVSLGDGPLGDGVTVDSARFEDATAHSAAVTLDAHGFSTTSSLIVTDRRTFDRALLDGAIAAGAVHDTSRVRDVRLTAAGGAATPGRGRAPGGSTPSGSRPRADGVTISTTADTWHAGHVIGADGANSLVRRRLGRAFERRQLSIATGFFAHGMTSREIVIRFVPEPQGYIWSFPRANHLAIGICAQADESRPGPLRDIVSTWITSSHLAPDVSLEPYSWPIPSLSAADFEHERPAGPGWMLAGDAAGLVDPITREGIYFALRSAQLAVDALTDAHDPAAQYHDALRDDIYPELSRAARVKGNFFRGPFTRLLIDALQRSEPVRAIMRDLVAGTQPYRTLRKRLIGTFEVGLAWQLLRLQIGR
jgi:geranylgeranyl reductase family protein